MLAELTPEQLTEWEAALFVLDWDVAKWNAAIVCEALHEVAERFASYDTDAQRMKAFAALPKASDFMGLVKLQEEKQALPSGFSIQTPQQIIETMSKLRK